MPKFDLKEHERRMREILTVPVARPIGERLVDAARRRRRVTPSSPKLPQLPKV